MNLVFYTAPMSSATPVATILSELEVPHQRIEFDLSQQNQRAPEFLELNPNGKVPTLVVDGTPIFEGLAIMQWLGDRFGVAKGLWPASDDPARLQALSWTTWSYVTFIQAVMRFNIAGNAPNPAEKSPAQRERCLKELEGYLDILEARLVERSFVLGNEFSLVDLIIACTVAYGAMCGVLLDRHERVAKWLSVCQSRPSFKNEWGGGA